MLPLFALPISVLGQKGCKFDKSHTLHSYLKPGQQSTPLIMAHQGGIENELPGNSLASFEKTYQEVPCVLLEFDVRMTRDSVLVVSHDNELELKTNGRGNLSDKKWQEIRRLKLKGSNGKITKSNIPTYDEVLNWSRNKSLILIVDKKPGTDLFRTISVLRKSGNLEKTVLICYSLKEAQVASKLAPELMLAVGFNSWEHISAIEKSGLPLDRLVALTPGTLQERKFYDKIHDLNVIASIGTNGNVDTLATSASRPLYLKIAKSGPDIICTDKPILVQSVSLKK